MKSMGEISKLKPLISLDIFDTAIFRKVFLPTDIFKVVENKIGNNFYQERIIAQNTVAAKVPNYTILDVYNAMPRKFSPKEEILAEMTLTEANPYILDLYNKKEYDFVFISDMYLPSVVLKKILENAGYKDPQVFVSCEEKALKGGGKLFIKVQEKLGRPIYKHIGDNYNADIKGAQKAGILHTEFVGPPIYKKQTTVPVLQNPILRKLLINNDIYSESTADKIGYLFAPLVLCFLKELLNEESELATQIYFNARDGFVFYLVAKYLLKTQKKIKYCRFSRKSVHLANFNTDFPLSHEINKYTMSFFLTLRVKTLRDILDMLNIKEVNHPLLDEYIEFSPKKQSIIKEFVLSIEDLLRQKAIKERENINKYIEFLGMKDGDLFVDLGHFGSMQSIIYNVANIKLRGRYVHMYDASRAFSNVILEKTSFLPKDYLKLYTGIAELVFTEPRGTVVGYNDRGIPVLAKDSSHRKEVSKSIIKGIIRGVKDLLKNKVDISLDDCILILDRFFKTPSIEEAQFGNQPLFENGSIEEESIVWYNKEWIERGEIRKCFGRSYWKTAFMVLLRNDEDYKNLVKELPKCPI